LDLNYDENPEQLAGSNKFVEALNKRGIHS